MGGHQTVVDFPRDLLCNDGERPNESDSQLDNGCAPSAFILRRLGNGFDMGMLLQILTQCLTQDAHTATMNDADARQPGQKSAVYEFLDFPGGIVHSASDHIDL